MSKITAILITYARKHTHTHLCRKNTYIIYFRIHVQFLNSNPFKCWPLRIKRIKTTKTFKCSTYQWPMQSISCLLLFLPLICNVAFPWCSFYKDCVMWMCHLCAFILIKSVLLSRKKTFIVLISIFGVCKIDGAFSIRSTLMQHIYPCENWYTFQ